MEKLVSKIEEKEFQQFKDLFLKAEDINSTIHRWEIQDEELFAFLVKFLFFESTTLEENKAKSSNVVEICFILLKNKFLKHDQNSKDLLPDLFQIITDSKNTTLQIYALQCILAFIQEDLPFIDDFKNNLIKMIEMGVDSTEKKNVSTIFEQLAKILFEKVEEFYGFYWVFTDFQLVAELFQLLNVLSVVKPECLSVDHTINCFNHYVQFIIHRNEYQKSDIVQQNILCILCSYSNVLQHLIDQNETEKILKNNLELSLLLVFELPSILCLSDISVSNSCKFIFRFLNLAYLIMKKETVNLTRIFIEENTKEENSTKYISLLFVFTFFHEKLSNNTTMNLEFITHFVMKQILKSDHYLCLVGLWCLRSLLNTNSKMGNFSSLIEKTFLKKLNHLIIKLDEKSIEIIESILYTLKTGISKLKLTTDSFDQMIYLMSNKISIKISKYSNYILNDILINSTINQDWKYNIVSMILSDISNGMKCNYVIISIISTIISNTDCLGIRGFIQKHFQNSIPGIDVSQIKYIYCSISEAFSIIEKESNLESQLLFHFEIVKYFTAKHILYEEIIQWIIQRLENYSNMNSSFQFAIHLSVIFNVVKHYPKNQKLIDFILKWFKNINSKHFMELVKEFQIFGENLDELLDQISSYHKSPVKVQKIWKHQNVKEITGAPKKRGLSNKVPSESTTLNDV
eukprot:gene7928-12396_t